MKVYNLILANLNNIHLLGRVNFRDFIIIFFYWIHVGEHCETMQNVCVIHLCTIFYRRTWHHRMVVTPPLPSVRLCRPHIDN